MNLKTFFKKLLVKTLMTIKNIKFPLRRIGGDEWVYQWRLDFLTNNLETESLEVCKNILSPGMTVIDIGAHIGYYTRFFSNIVGTTGQVIAFEPCSENFPFLSYNLSPKKFQNVEIYNLAIGEKNSEGFLHISPGHSNHSLISGYTETMGEERVIVKTLDSIIIDLGIQKIDLVKIDVEGGELSVLRGMQNTIKRFPDIKILMEYNVIALQSGNITPQNLLSLISDLGLIPMRVGEGGELFQEFEIFDQNTFNILCLPRTSV